MPGRKVMVIGLDSAPPSLVFEEFAKELPTLTRLREEGLWGRLRSTNPPITVPAWSVMFTGKNPGRLGFTGFRNLTRGTYDDQWIAFGDRVKEPRVWDLAGEAGHRVIVHGVPQTWPPYTVNGVLTSCFLTPGPEYPWTHPVDLAAEIEARLGRPYSFDVEGYRREDKGALLEEIYAHTDCHFDAAEYLLAEKSWDLFVMVEMGTDRIHHALWSFMDRAHRRHPGTTPLMHAVLEYYKHVDARVARLLAMAPADAAVLVVSDHGAKRMDGAVNLNDWLVREGYLVLKRRPSGVTEFRPDLVDWSRTRAWALGGYYGRVYVNKKGREPQGIVEERDYEALRAELAARIAAIPDDAGRPLRTRVERPEDVYAGPHVSQAPDLQVYLGDLHWRVNQGVGNPDLYSTTAEIGPDEANHDWDGILVLHDPLAPGRGREVAGLDLRDVAPTVLRLLGVPVPADLEGREVVA